MADKKFNHSDQPICYNGEVPPPFSPKLTQTTSSGFYPPILAKPEKQVLQRSHYHLHYKDIISLIVIP